MRQVESTIVELGQMFTRMAALVAEQGETVDRIDAHMDVTYVAVATRRCYANNNTQMRHRTTPVRPTTCRLDNVKAGQDELNKFYASVMSNRGFIVKLLAVLLVVIAVFMWSRRG